ncbi:MAG: metal ABC transporter permease [Sporomusaceae bacterium]|nr:metal ABC transporter permease [Sporomusaceae bacterium]
MDFLQYDFMQRAFIAGIVTAIICPLIGIFVVVRRQSLIGDGLGHIAFAGVTGGYLLGLYPPIAAACLTVLGAVSIEWMRQRQKEYSDMVLALFFYAGIACAIIFSSMTKMPSIGLLNFLFGSIITVTEKEIMLIGGGALFVSLTAYLLFDRLMLMALDEEVARISGIPIVAINLIFAVITALVVVVGMTVAGILLVSALMIVPVATAHLLQKGFRKTLVYAILYSVLAVLIGLTASYHLDIAPGGTIVISAILEYIVTYLFSVLALKRQ